MMPDRTHPTPARGFAAWRPIVGCYLAGVLAAAQLGKMSALAPLVAAELQLSLPTVALAVSLIELGGATLGVIAGALASRLGLQRSLLGGLVCLCAAALGLGFVQGGAALLGWRLVEAVGYLAVVVTAPVLIVRSATPVNLVAPAMVLWSTFVPVGIACGAWGWSQVAALADWRVAMFGGAGLAALALVVGGSARRSNHGSSPDAGHDTAPARRVRMDPATWWLSASFGCYALFEVGLLALLPLYLTREAGLSAAEAGRWAAGAALATIAGSMAAAAWLRHGHSPRWPVVLSLLLPALLLFTVFVERPQAVVVGWLALLLNAISGAYPSFAFAWLPLAAGPRAALVRANGVFTQFGASGSLLGPPTMAFVVDHFGWTAAPWLGLAVTLPSLWLALKVSGRMQARRYAASSPG